MRPQSPGVPRLRGRIPWASPFVILVQDRFSHPRHDRFCGRQERTFLCDPSADYPNDAHRARLDDTSRRPMPAASLCSAAMEQIINDATSWTPSTTHQAFVSGVPAVHACSPNDCGALISARPLAAVERTANSGNPPLVESRLGPHG